MPPGTAELKERLARLPYRIVKQDGELWIKREKHNLRSFVLSSVALILSMHYVSDMNSWMLHVVFEEQLADILCVVLAPIWGIFLYFKIPPLFLMEPLSANEKA